MLIVSAANIVALNALNSLEPAFVSHVQLWINSRSASLLVRSISLSVLPSFIVSLILTIF